MKAINLLNFVFTKPLILVLLDYIKRVNDIFYYKYKFKKVKKGNNVVS